MSLNSLSPREYSSDSNLVILVREGNPEAFDVLLGRYTSIIRSRAYKYSGGFGADFEDFTQEAMIALFRAVKNFDPRKGVQFSTYATACINNAMNATARKHLERISRDALNIEDIDECIYPAPDAKPVEDLYLDKEISRMWNLEIKTLLSNFEQRVLRLYLGGYTYHQISQNLNSSTKAVDNALQRVRRKLRSLL